MSSTGAGISFRILKRALLQGPITPHQRFVCVNCQRATRLQNSQSNHKYTKSIPLTRTFSSTVTQHKKSSGSSKSPRSSPAVTSSKNKSPPIPNNAATERKDNEVDPYDYTELEDGIGSAIARLKDALTKTRDAGRVSTEMIEALTVEYNVKHPDGGKGKEGSKPHHEKMKLGDMATVVPKGARLMQIYAAEESHVKPLLSALSASTYSLVPEQPDATNSPLLIHVPVPPATAETRSQAAAEAKKCFDRASLDVRNARGDAQKRFRKMELGKLVIQDELRKAHKGMEDVVKKGQDEVKKVYEGSLKALQQ